MILKNFDNLNLSKEMMNAIIQKGYINTTAVQSQTIPPMMEWKDIIAKAPTGTGKTFAFGIPIIEHIDPLNYKIQALILAPTRELADQICSELKSLAQYKKGIKAISIYGGGSIINQINELKRCPQIVVATPGRLLDHINRRTIKLDAVQTAVLDEADRMVDMGFYKDVKKILDLVPNRKNLALLSATISREVMDISWIYQKDPVEITIKEDVENKPDIIQYSLKTEENKKSEAITLIMKSEGYEKAIVFCNTKFKVERVAKTLNTKGYNVSCIHGDIRQNTREKVLHAFKNGKLNILVATDVASRGIDVEDIDAVINYDIPDQNEYYIHRIGRTGRAKKQGSAYTLISRFTDTIRINEIAKNTKSNITQLNIEKFYCGV